MKKNAYFLIALAVLVFCCKQEEKNFDAAGNFEATEYIISAEATGKLLVFNVEEGQQMNANQEVGHIDDTSLRLKKEQLEASVKAVLSKAPDVATQLLALQQQIRNLEQEKRRFENLVKLEAVPPKQLDDINYQISVLQDQVKATTAQLTTQRSGILAEVEPLQKQIAQVDDQIAKSKLINPVSGTVISKYSHAYEFVTTGKPLYKIADLEQIILRAYFSGAQLGQVKLGQSVTVLVDQGKEGYRSYPGEISWISGKSEFTPKNIQTKEERVNMVYAVKIRVKNDGYLKIGMPAEVKLQQAQPSK